MKSQHNQKPIQNFEKNNQYINYQSQVESVIPIPEDFQLGYFQRLQKKQQNSQITYNNAQEVSKLLKVICLIGITGTGKSTTANTICGKPGAFKVSADMESCTQETTGIFFKWPTQENQNQESQEKQDEEEEEDDDDDGDDGDEEEKEEKDQPFLVIDTPGLCDYNGRDTENIAKMVCFLKSIEYVNSFVICFNSQDPRLDENKQRIIKLFSEMFGQEFFKNIILCFTRWSYDKKSEISRKKKNQGQTEVISQMKQQFRNKLQGEIKDDQFIFIDNDYSNPEYAEDCEQQEIQKHQEQLKILRQKTQKNGAFWCKDLKNVQKENDKFQEYIKKQEEYLNQKQIQIQEQFDQQKQKQNQQDSFINEQDNLYKSKYEQQMEQQLKWWEKEKNEILQKQEEQQNFLLQKSLQMDNNMKQFEDKIIQQNREMQEEKQQRQYQQQIQEQEQKQEQNKVQEQKSGDNYQTFFKILDTIGNVAGAIKNATNNRSNISSSNNSSNIRASNNKSNTNRCKDGTLDMRFAVNKGKDKYKD